MTYHNIVIYRYIDMNEKRDHTVSTTQFEQTAAVLRVLAHPHRLAICARLTAAHVSVKEIAEQLGLPHNVVSQHLNAMKAHGLLESQRQGKTVYYRVVDPRPLWLLECMRRHQTPPLEQ